MAKDQRSLTNYGRSRNLGVLVTKVSTQTPAYRDFLAR